jgi:hypothetical protein
MNATNFKVLKDEISLIAEKIKNAKFDHEPANAAYAETRQSLTDLQTKLLQYIVELVKSSKTRDTSKIEALNSMLKDFLEIFSSLGKKITELDVREGDQPPAA